MLLYRSSEARAVQAPGLDGAAGEVLRRCGVGDGQPFVLGPDGAYDLNLNRFLRELDGWGVRSAHTVVAYARDLMLFARFLHERRGGRSLWRADQEDLRAYKRARRHTPGFEVSAATWNRFLAALDKWVEWALYERLLTERPFRMVERTVLTGRGLARVVVNAEREVDDETAPVRFLPYVDYLLWRDVGLRGLLPDGGPDRGWRGRHGRRNAAFADLLVCTGMRLGEASSLLLPEVPAADGRAMTGAVQLASAVTKRNRARTVFVTRRVLRELHHWVEMERDELVTRKTAARVARCGCGWARTACRCRPRRARRCSAGPTSAAPGLACRCGLTPTLCATRSRCTCSACCCARRCGRCAASRAGR